VKCDVCYEDTKLIKTSSQIAIDTEDYEAAALINESLEEKNQLFEQVSNNNLVIFREIFHHKEISVGNAEIEIVSMIIPTISCSS
jgi:hypothetical protein